MSASPIFSSAAPSRPFIFSPPAAPSYAEEFAEKSARTRIRIRNSATKTAEILAAVGAAAKLAAIVPASHLNVRPAPEMVSSGIPQLDTLTGGLALGCLTEICGAASSGRTSILLCALARATQGGEVCALVDASDVFDPVSAGAAGMEMSRLLWVRCGEKYPSRKHRSTGGSPPADSYQGMPSGIPLADKKVSGFSRWKSQLAQMLKVTDLLLQSKGFGMIVLDLGDVPAQSARRIPLSWWFRFRRAVEHTQTVLLILEQQPIAGSCSSMLIKVSANRAPRPDKKLSAVSSPLSGNRATHSGLTHSELLDQFEITAQLLCSRLERKSERKPMQSTASFTSRAAWAFG